MVLHTLAVGAVGCILMLAQIQPYDVPLLTIGKQEAITVADDALLRLLHFGAPPGVAAAVAMDNNVTFSCDAARARIPSASAASRAEWRVTAAVIGDYSTVDDFVSQVVAAQRGDDEDETLFHRLVRRQFIEVPTWHIRYARFNEEASLEEREVR